MTEKQKLKAKLIKKFVEHGTLRSYCKKKKRKVVNSSFTHCQCCGQWHEGCVCDHNERLAIIEEVFGD